jgi:branched-chain amino acid transport system ATP-binding protein
MAAVTLLSTSGLGKTFGGLEAVKNVDFDLEAGEIRAIIGPNGAGKTTFVSLLSGRLPATTGRVRFKGRDITRMPAHARVRAGIAYTFQITSIYPRLSTLDNVKIAAQSSAGNVGDSALGQRAHGALDQVGIGEKGDELAGQLAYGHQRLLEVAMGLALDPVLLILDEPTQGLSDGEIDSFCDLVREIAKSATILLIEHNMAVVMELADRITVLNFGAVLAEGNPAEIRANDAVQSAYLGS